MFWIGFIAGSVVMLIGLIIYSCLVVASRSDQQMEEEFSGEAEDWM